MAAHPITFELNGEKISLCWNIFAQITLSEQYGTTEAAYEAISGETSEANVLRGFCNWLYALAVGAVQERISNGREPEELATWLASPTAIMANLSPFDIGNLGASINDAIAAGEKREVKASAKKKKE